MSSAPRVSWAVPNDPLRASWTQIGLSWDPLAQRLRNDSCNRDQDRFDACLLAIAAVAAALEPPLVPVPQKTPDAGPFGFATWQPVPGAVDNPYSLEARAEREHAVAAIWAGRPASGLDFEAMLAWLQTQFDPGDTAILSARGTAAFLRRARDPHTAIAPYHAVDSAYHRTVRGNPLQAFFRGRNRARGRPSLQSEALFEHGFRIARITVPHVDDVTCVEVSSALDTLLERGARGVILDLRGNLGGVSREAACVADLFLPRGTKIVRMESLVPDFDSRDLRAQSEAVVAAPVVVIIDAWSASGAEVIAASLQANRRGLIVGTRSFGKGTYQEATPWVEHEDVVFYRTVARLVVGSGFEFQMHGVIPDLGTEAGDPNSKPDSDVVWREENAYVNPIPARLPPVPTQAVAAIRGCLKSRKTPPGKDPALTLARGALWCWLSGTIPGV